MSNPEDLNDVTDGLDADEDGDLIHDQGDREEEREDGYNGDYEYTSNSALVRIKCMRNDMYVFIDGVSLW